MQKNLLLTSNLCVSVLCVYLCILKMFKLEMQEHFICQIVTSQLNYTIILIERNKFRFNNSTQQAYRL